MLIISGDTIATQFEDNLVVRIPESDVIFMYAVHDIDV